MEKAIEEEAKNTRNFSRTTANVIYDDLYTSFKRYELNQRYFVKKGNKHEYFTVSKDFCMFRVHKNETTHHFPKDLLPNMEKYITQIDVLTYTLDSSNRLKSLSLNGFPIERPSISRKAVSRTAYIPEKTRVTRKDEQQKHSKSKKKIRQNTN
jgi:hypothetical protein